MNYEGSWVLFTKSRISLNRGSLNRVSGVPSFKVVCKKYILTSCNFSCKHVLARMKKFFRSFFAVWYFGRITFLHYAKKFASWQRMDKAKKNFGKSEKAKDGLCHKLKIFEFLEKLRVHFLVIYRGHFMAKNISLL